MVRINVRGRNLLFLYSLLRKNPSRENRLLPCWWSRLIVDEKTRCVSFSVACREWWKGAKGGVEGKDRKVGEQEKQRTLVESFVQTEGTSMCVTFAASKRPCTRLFSFHRASLTSLSFDVSILSFSLGYASFFFFFFFLLFLEMYARLYIEK